MDLNEQLRVTDSWSLKGELTLSCNCEVFCPCVLSLGQSAPTEGYCLTWACVRVDEGHFGETDLAGVKFGFMAEIPGKLGRGNWTVALFVDDKASVQASKALTWIMTGRAGGSTGLLKILAGSFLGTRQVPIVYETQGRDPHHQDREDRRRRDHAGARQGQGQRRHPQQRILDLAGHHRVARRQVALPSARPQLEFRGQVGGNLQARLGQSKAAVTLPHSARDR